MLAPESERSSNNQNSPESIQHRQNWSAFRDELGSVLVVGHGTRNPSGARQLLELVGHMQAKEPNANISGCFLELAEPTIEQAIERLHNLGIKKILVVPVLLFTAAHALQDIPDAVALAAKKLGIEVVGQTGSLGTHESVVALSQTRYSEVTCLEQGGACPENGCAQVQCTSGRCEGQGKRMGRIGLAMVGRGTSDPLALDHMRQLTQLKIQQLSTVANQTGFFAGGKPNVDGFLRKRPNGSAIRYWFSLICCSKGNW